MYISPAQASDAIDRALPMIDEEIPDTFDPVERAKEKQASRDKDAADLASGLKTPDDLRKENGKFAFPNSKVDLKSAKRLY